MLKTVRSRADERFAATRHEDKRVLKGKEKVLQEKAELVARLRTLSRAKGAAGQQVAGSEDAANTNNSIATAPRSSTPT